MNAQFRFLTETLAAPEYDCMKARAHSPEDWSRLYGERQLILGVWSIVLGVISLILYIPSIIFFWHEKQFTCIKIMGVLAAVDIIGIFNCGILFGIQMLLGAVFCSHKIFILISGLTAYGCWNVSSLTCVFLIVNRILELTRRERFEGTRCNIVLQIIATYGIAITFFMPSSIANSKHQSMRFCPFIPGYDCSLYVNYAHFIHNTLICVLVPALFIVFYVILRNNSNKIESSSNLKNIQSKIFTQGAIICIVNFGESFVWILMNLFPTPQFVITIGMIGLQLIHASPCLVYLVLNQRVRGEMMKIMSITKYETAPASQTK